jgi:hypothetical protein
LDVPWGFIVIGSGLLLSLVFIGALVILVLGERNRVEP